MIEPTKSETIPVALTEEEADQVVTTEILSPSGEKARSIISGLLSSLPTPSGPIKVRILCGLRDTDYFSDK